MTLLWRRYLDEQIYLGTAATLEQALAEAGVVPHSEALPPTIVFLDLTAFTHVTDRNGDEAAASGATTLTRVMRRVVVASGGSMVKMLGDGAMLHFDEPAAAVGACVRLRSEIRDAGLSTARFGVNAGPLMVRDVDYYGHNVNVAARLLDYARPNEILVTNHVVQSVDADDLSFRQVGEVSLKGVGGLVDVWMATAD